jgi:serine/threonine protein kinase
VISTQGRLRGRHLALKKVRVQLKLPWRSCCYNSTNTQEKVPHSANIIPSVSLHRAICHPNIVALHSAIDLSSAPHFAYWHVLEFCSGGNLSDLLRSQDLSEPELRLVTKGITSALIFLKEERIIHRNIDSTNILLGQGCKPVSFFIRCIYVSFVLRILLSFFFRKFATSNMQFVYIQGKALFRSHWQEPFIQLRKRNLIVIENGQWPAIVIHLSRELLTIPSLYDFAVDTWSFGCVLYICIGVNFVFYGKNTMLIASLLGNRWWHPEIGFWKCISLVSQMFTRTPMLNTLSPQYRNYPSPNIAFSVDWNLASLQMND